MVHSATQQSDVVKLLTTPGYREFAAFRAHVVETVAAAALPLLEEKDSACTAAVQAGCLDVVAAYDLTGVSATAREQVGMPTHPLRACEGCACTC